MCQDQAAQNSPELSLLKFLPSTYHHSHFLAATLDFTFFFHHSLSESRTVGCFGLDLLYKELNVYDSPVFLDHVNTSTEEVFELLSSLKVNKACGPDKICARLLKEGAAELSPSLTTLFNKLLQDAVLPLDWVSAKVCPVYKKGDKQCVSNYCPISLTCLLAKVLERIVHSRLYSMLEQSNILCDNQFG